MIFIDSELLQFFFAKHKVSRITIMKNKGANRFHKCFIHTPIYSRCFYIIHTLLLNVYRRTNPYIYKKRVHCPILITMLALSKVFSIVPKRTFGSSGIILK